MARTVEFWFEFASTYAYLSAMRVDVEAEKRGVDVVWRPFLLGPIFTDQGWNTSPFVVYPAKGAYMWRDLERRSAKLGLAFNRPPTDTKGAFPRNSVLAARVAGVALEQAWGKAYCRNIYMAEWVDGRDIADPDIVANCIAEAGGNASEVMAESQTPERKLALREAVETARNLGIFGAPSFISCGELYWGDDRLEDALDAAALTS